MQRVAVLRPVIQVEAEIEDAGILRADTPGPVRTEQFRDHVCQDAAVGEYEHPVIVPVPTEQALNYAIAPASTPGQRFRAFDQVPVTGLFDLHRDIRVSAGYLRPGEPRKYSHILLLEIVPIGDRKMPGGRHNLGGLGSALLGAGVNMSRLKVFVLESVVEGLGLGSSRFGQLELGVTLQPALSVAGRLSMSHEGYSHVLLPNLIDIRGRRFGGWLTQLSHRRRALAILRPERIRPGVSGQDSKNPRLLPGAFSNTNM